MAPLIKKLTEHNAVDLRLCVTGQHKEMLDQVLDFFELEPDYNLSVMQPGQELTDVTCAILNGMRDLFSDYKPDLVLVHGDTCTTVSTALAAYYASIPVSHVEAGLRTGNLYAPWPEEANRKVTGVIANRHYAPTLSARNNLIAEGVDDCAIAVTGNTVIDALFWTVTKLNDSHSFVDKNFDYLSTLDDECKLILVTGHRRENFGDGMASICKALASLATRPDVQIVYPVHLNPNVQTPVDKYLSKLPNVLLIPPLDYLPFVSLLEKCFIVITDSGGIQEEAPSLGKPVLVMRDVTERPEAVEAGTVKLVGTCSEKIVLEASRLLDDPSYYQMMSTQSNPYGDGNASDRIVEDIVNGE